MVGCQVQVRPVQELLQLVGTGRDLQRFHQFQRRLAGNAIGHAGAYQADRLHGGKLLIAGAQQNLPCRDGLLVGVCQPEELLPLCGKRGAGQPPGGVGCSQGKQAQKQSQRRDTHGHIAHGLRPAAVVNQQVCVQP